MNRAWQLAEHWQADRSAGKQADWQAGGQMSRQVLLMLISVQRLSSLTQRGDRKRRAGQPRGRAAGRRRQRRGGGEGTVPVE